MKHPDPRCPKHGCLLEWCDGSWFCTECSDEWDIEEGDDEILFHPVKTDEALLKADHRWLKQTDLFAETEDK